MRVKCITALVLGLICFLAGCSMTPVRPEPALASVPEGPQIICPAGYSACVGEHGQMCYDPAAGENCTQGLVCPSNYVGCVGGAVNRCYQPAAGETCN